MYTAREIITKALRITDNVQAHEKSNGRGKSSALRPCLHTRVVIFHPREALNVLQEQIRNPNRSFTWKLSHDKGPPHWRADEYGMQELASWGRSVFGVIRSAVVAQLGRNANDDPRPNLDLWAQGRSVSMNQTCVQHNRCHCQHVKEPVELRKEIRSTPAEHISSSFFSPPSRSE